MPKKIPFDAEMQITIKDYVDSQRWSNSQFAQRYCDKFTELYGKQEVPSTSTSRKLIEDKNHVFTEREMIVLEKLTGINFYEKWLKEQERVICQKKIDYRHADDASKIDGSFDSEAQLNSMLRRFGQYADRLSINDLSESITRYVNIDTRKPLVIICDSLEFAEYMVKECVERPLRVDTEKLLSEGQNYPNKTIYTSLKGSPMGIKAGKCVNDALKVIRLSSAIGKVKRVIAIIESSDEEAISQAQKEWDNSILLLKSRWSYQLMLGWAKIEEGHGLMHKVLKEYITSIETQNTENRNKKHIPAFAALYSYYTVSRNHLDMNEEQLLLELIKNETAIDMVYYLIEKIYKTEDRNSTFKIYLILEKQVFSEPLVIPEKTKRRIEQCIDKMRICPESFKDEIRCWVEQGGSVVMPDCKGSHEWADFIMNQYEKQKDWLEDESYLAALEVLKKYGFPMNWFADDCDQKSILTAIITFPKWKIPYEHSKEVWLQLKSILLSGSAPSLDAEGWTKWFDRVNYKTRISPDFNIDWEIEKLQRKMRRTDFPEISL